MYVSRFVSVLATISAILIAGPGAARADGIVGDIVVGATNNTNPIVTWTGGSLATATSIGFTSAPADPDLGPYPINATYNGQVTGAAGGFLTIVPPGQSYTLSFDNDGIVIGGGTSGTLDLAHDGFGNLVDLNNLNNFTIVDAGTGAYPDDGFASGPYNPAFTFQAAQSVVYASTGQTLVSHIVDQSATALDVWLYGTLTSPYFDPLTVSATLGVSYAGTNPVFTFTLNSPPVGVLTPTLTYSDVPESGSIALLGGGLVAAFAARRRRV